MRAVAALFLILLTACQAGPDVRAGFTERNVGKTLVTFVEGLGTQVVHMDGDGGLSLWSSARAGVQKGRWRYDQLATGVATSFQGAGGINHPVQQLQTDWGVCFQYIDDAGNVMRRPEGGDWNCALFTAYESLVIERAPGDVFGLAGSQALPPLPVGQRLDIAGLRAL